jgi:hypothetical protein
VHLPALISQLYSRTSIVPHGVSLVQDESLLSYLPPFLFFLGTFPSYSCTNKLVKLVLFSRSNTPLLLFGLA